MTKCDNCSNPADYSIQDRGSLPQAFCQAHLPRIYAARAKQGTLIKVENKPVTAQKIEPEESVVEAVADSTSNKKKSRKKLVEDTADVENTEAVADTEAVAEFEEEIES